MNLAFLISFMTFHFYLNLAFHTNIFTIRIVIVIYFNLKKKKILIRLALYPYSNLFGSSQPAQTEHFQNQALQPIFLTLTFFDFISVGICHIFLIYDRKIFGE